MSEGLRTPDSHIAQRPAELLPLYSAILTWPLPHVLVLLSKHHARTTKRQCVLRHGNPSRGIWRVSGNEAWGGLAVDFDLEIAEPVLPQTREGSLFLVLVYKLCTVPTLEF